MVYKMYFAMFLTMFLLMGVNSDPNEAQMKSFSIDVALSCDSALGCLGGNPLYYISQNEHSKWILDRLATLQDDLDTTVQAAATARADAAVALTVAQIDLAKATETLGDHNKLKTRYNELVC